MHRLLKLFLVCPFLFCTLVFTVQQPLWGEPQPNDMYDMLSKEVRATYDKVYPTTSKHVREGPLILGRNEMDDVYDLFSKTADADDPNRFAMKQAIASKDGEDFLKAYLAGDTKQAQTYYAKMLKRLEKIETIDDINNLMVSRFALDIPENQPLKTQYSGETLNKFLLSATEKAVTKNHRFYGDCLGNLARILEKEKHYKEAIPLREQQCKLFQKLFGAEKEKALIILTQWGVDEGDNKNFPAGEALLKKSLAAAAKRHYRFTLKQAGHAYFNLLMQAHRPSDAVAFRTNLLKQFPDIKY